MRALRAADAKSFRPLELLEPLEQFNDSSCWNGSSG